MRIIEVIQRTAPFFEKQGVESPRLTIELLLAHLLKKRRLDLYMEFERELDAATLEKLREIVRRRAGGEPLQYITGEAEFCGLKFAVDRRVLIPRPETELLVETVLEQIKRKARSPESEVLSPESTVRSVDLRTGSGCLPATENKQRSELTQTDSGLRTQDSRLRVMDLCTGSDFVCQYCTRPKIAPMAHIAIPRYISVVPPTPPSPSKLILSRGGIFRSASPARSL